MKRERFYFLHILSVSFYLAFVSIFLLMTKRLTYDISFPRLILKAIKRKWIKIFKKEVHTAIGGIKKDIGNCYIASIKTYLVSDKDGKSDLEFYEDGKCIGPAHSPHHIIRDRGLGSYSHWGDYIYFSASDNSDPRTNRKKYSFTEQDKQ